MSMNEGLHQRLAAPPVPSPGVGAVPQQARHHRRVSFRRCQVERRPRVVRGGIGIGARSEEGLNRRRITESRRAAEPPRKSRLSGGMVFWVGE